MDIQQLEVFECRDQDEDEAARLSQEHFGPLEIIIDRLDRDGEMVYYAYAVEQVESLLNQVAEYVIKKFDPGASISIHPNSNYSEFVVDMKSRSQANIIGRHGATIDALELMIGIICNRQFPLNRIVLLDIDGYRKRREEALENMARGVMREIEKDHRERAIPNLLPKERRIIHKFLSDHPYLTTESRGKGFRRTLYIVPREFSQSADADQDDDA